MFAFPSKLVQEANCHASE